MSDTPVSDAGLRRDHGPLKVGLTGGIASGKTAVSDALAALGASVVDTDVVAREVVAPGSEGLAAVREAFGDEILAADGSLDRRRLRTLVFADERRRRELEGILHPRIRRRTFEAVNAADGAYVVIVVPLLAESDFHELVDVVVVVDCDEATQLERLMARDDHDEAEARRMIAAQSSREARLALADHVIDNTGDRDALHAQVTRLHRALLAQADTHNTN